MNQIWVRCYEQRSQDIEIKIYSFFKLWRRFYNKHSVEILKTVLNEEVVNLYKLQYVLDGEMKEEKLSYFYLVRRNDESSKYGL